MHCLAGCTCTVCCCSLMFVYLESSETSVTRGSVQRSMYSQLGSQHSITCTPSCTCKIKKLKKKLSVTPLAFHINLYIMPYITAHKVLERINKNCINLSRGPFWQIHLSLSRECHILYMYIFTTLTWSWLRWYRPPISLKMALLFSSRRR